MKKFKVVFILAFLIISLSMNSCKKAENLKFAGSYSGTMDCSGNTSVQTILVNASGSNAKQITVYFDEHPLTATVSGNSLSIREQTVYDSSGTLDISGSGTLYDGTLYLSFFVYVHGSGSVNCNFTGSK